MYNLNPTETSCCRRCQSDSGTYCVCAQELHTHLAGSNNHPSSQPRHPVHSLDRGHVQIHGMISDVLFFFWFVGHVEEAAVMLSVGFFFLQYDACHTWCLIILPASRVCFAALHRSLYLYFLPSSPLSISQNDNDTPTFSSW